MPWLETPADRVQWLQMRHSFIGGSEVASLYPREYRAGWHKSLYALYHHKRGPAPTEDEMAGSERAMAGLMLEPGVAAYAAWRRDWKITKGPFAVNDFLKGSASTLDFVVEEPGPEEIALGFQGRGVLQVKLVDYIQHREHWPEDDAPWPYVLQVQKEMYDANLDWGCIAALVGGNKLVIYPYSRDRELECDMAQRIENFWADVEAGREPAIDGDASTTEALLKLFPEIVDETIDLTGSNIAAKYAALYTQARDAEKAAAEQKNEAKNHLLHLIGSSKRADLPGGLKLKVKETKETKGKAITKGMVGMLIGARKGSRSIEIDGAA